MAAGGGQGKGQHGRRGASVKQTTGERNKKSYWQEDVCSQQPAAAAPRSGSLSGKQPTRKRLHISTPSQTRA